MILLSGVVGPGTLLLALFFFAVWCRSRARVRRRLGLARRILIAFVVVGFEQRRDALLLVFRIERVRRHIVDVDWVGIERPKERLNVTLIVEPRAQPKGISARHEFAGHLAMRGRQRLKEMKHAPVANRPRREHKDERKGKSGTGCDDV